MNLSAVVCRLLTFPLAFLLCPIAGCVIDDGIYDELYEGLRAREAIVHPAAELNPPENSMPFWHYDTERTKVLQNKDLK